MEPAKIDWKRIDSKFVEDVFYEHIRAPTWYDFLASEDDSVDDEAWFCRPDCNHPKTAKDFLRTTPTSKLPSTSDVNEVLPLHDRNQRDMKLKRRGQTTTRPISSKEDAENQNPNVSTPPDHQAKTWKAAFKSSSVKQKDTDEKLQNEEAPRLKSTLSARKLFAGKDILSQITEFCNDLKKLATRARDRENEAKLNEGKSRLDEKNEASTDVLCKLEAKEEDRERTPLLKGAKEISEDTDRGSSTKEKCRRKKRVDDAENIPISINLENIKHREEERLLQIRTNPPSPQCFSVTRAPTRATHSKALRSNPIERGILQEVRPKNEVMAAGKNEKSVSSPIVDARESKGLDVFWFLKPCTMAG